jgi:FtsP/CotA-like multicopper oxidase with cupredoxin domain
LPLSGAGLRAAFGSQVELPPLTEVAFDRSEPGLARGVLTAIPASPIVAGRTVEALTYNGAFPGPLMRLREGETVQLRFQNRLDVHSNLHFHGLSLQPGGRADNVWLHVPPGESFDYEFTVPRGDAGLHWYHPHVHGATARAMFRGLTGAILVEGERDFERELDCDERICVLKDVTLDGGRIQGHHPMEWSVGKEGELLLVNGVSRPVIRARRSLVRLRLLNASNARFWRLRLSNGDPLQVIAHDGRYLDAPRALSELLLVPGARAEILVAMDRREPVDLVYVPTPRRGMAFTREQPVMTLEPPAQPARVHLPPRLVAWDRFDAARAETERDVILSLFNICGKFMDASRVDIRTHLGAREIWRVRNVDVMDHPFHLHTWHYEVLDVNGVPPPYPARFDMFNVREGDVVRIGVHFIEHTGRTLYHCHFAEHSDRGMMAVLEVL